MYPKSLKKLDEGTLQIEWDDGHFSKFNIPYLRENCPCAYCKEARRNPANHKPVASMTGAAAKGSPSPKPTILEAHVVGKYAIKFIWTDGHEDGIYPFSLLRELCQCDTCLAQKSGMSTAGE